VSLRVGIAGCGLVAGGPIRDGKPIATNHAAACRSVEGVELVAAADPTSERREAFSSFWNVPSVYPSVAAMLEHEKLDIVIVATPPEGHESVCLAAIEANVPGLLCEKPFTGSAAGARRVVAACRSANTHLAVNFVRRWDAGHQALARRIRDGVIGDVRSAWGCYTGTIRGNGSHLLDTLRMMIRSNLAPVWTSSLNRTEQDGPLAGVIESRDGARVLFTNVPADYFIFELHILGARGRARLLAQGLDLRIDEPRADPAFPGYRYLREAQVVSEGTLLHAFPRCLSALAGAVRNGTELESPPEDFVTTLELLDSVVADAHGTKEKRP
jgi:predicted dehydrogenase